MDDDIRVKVQNGAEHIDEEVLPKPNAVQASCQVSQVGVVHQVLSFVRLLILGAEFRVELIFKVDGGRVLVQPLGRVCIQGLTVALYHRFFALLR